MIYVTEGHERGIGLEIFLKSILLLPKQLQQNFTLFVEKKSFNETLSTLNISPDFFSNINIHFTTSHLPISTSTLEDSLKNISSKDVLITLPTSKDQLIFNGSNCAGYTEYFRKYFNTENIPMTFRSFNENILLITDHLPLKEVSAKINAHLILNKLEKTLKGSQKYFTQINQIVLAGINPHAGESGVLGNEEVSLNEIPNLIREKFNIECTPFLSGDTLHLYQKKLDTLFVYMYHDQGLARFKSENGFIGVNITHGLPFLRLSVDHGTAFDLYGKNKANITSMIFLLKLAVEVHNNVN